MMEVRRRSARLLQRAAVAASGGSPIKPTRAVAASACSEPPQDAPTQQQHRRQRVPLPKQPSAAVAQQQPGGTAAGTAGTPSTEQQQLQVLGSITNLPELQGAPDASAAAAAAVAAGPPAKRPRGRPPRAAAAVAEAAEAAAVEATQTADVPTAANTSSHRATQSKASSKASSSNKSAAGPTQAAEQRLWAQGFQAVAGVDEAGRGPLAGPVVAAAAVLPRGVVFDGLHDSKQLDEAAREAVYEQLTTHEGVSYAVAMVDAATVDRINILQAAMLAMSTAVEGLTEAGLQPDHLLIDGNRRPSGIGEMPAQLVVKGDAAVTCIAAASVIAKVTRDRLMLQLDQQYPQYGFAQHKGYGVPAHRAAIQQHGPCPQHRRSFEPIKSLTAWPGYPKPPGAAQGVVLKAVVRRQPGGGGGGGGAAAGVEGGGAARTVGV